MHSILYLTIINPEVKEYYKNNIDSHITYNKFCLYYPTPYNGVNGINIFELGIKCEMVDKKGKKTGYNILTSYQVASTGFSCSHNNIRVDDDKYKKEIIMYLYGNNGKKLHLDPGCYFYLTAEDGDSFRICIL